MSTKKANILIGSFNSTRTDLDQLILNSEKEPNTSKQIGYWLSRIFHENEDRKWNRKQLAVGTWAVLQWHVFYYLISIITFAFLGRMARTFKTVCCTFIAIKLYWKVLLFDDTQIDAFKVPGAHALSRSHPTLMVTKQKEWINEWICSGGMMLLY